MQPRVPKARLNASQSISRPDTARSSLNSSIVSTTSYPRCNRKKQHAKEMMNLVCLTSTCKDKGPICSICKTSEHSGHIVIPMKTFLNNLQSNLQNGTEEGRQKNQKTQNIMTEEEPVDSFSQSQFDQSGSNLPKEEALAILESQKIQMFSLLSHFVTKIATQIQKIETKICQDFNNLQNQIANLYETQANAANLVEELIEKAPQDPEQYCQQVGSLLQIITVHSKDKYLIQSEFCQQKMAIWKTKSENFVQNLENWADSSLDNLRTVFDAPRQKTKTDTTAETPLTGFKFSVEDKMKSIKITDKVIKQTAKLQGLAFLEGPSVKGKKLNFRIKGFSSGIGFGIGLKDIVKTKGFKANTSAIGHGVFLAFSNSYIYSHNDKGFNMVMQGISFANGAEITVHVRPDSLEISKKGETKAAQIPLKKMSQAEWKQANFCVMLSGIGDSVELIS